MLQVEERRISDSSRKQDQGTLGCLLGNVELLSEFGAHEFIMTTILLVV